VTNYYSVSFLRRRRLVKLRCCFLLVFPLPLWCGSTTALFQPFSPSVGPYPNNALTIQTATQKTGLQVNLPLPSGCTLLSTSAQCINTQLLNQLDGFSVSPRITVCFSGPVDVTTLRQGIKIIAADHEAPPIGINQAIFDPARMCAYAKPDQVLDQQTRYLLVVTSDVEDADGKKLKADPNYSDCVKRANSDYCQALSRAIDTLRKKHGKDKNDLTESSSEEASGHFISASLFTTLSATSWLEKAHTQVNFGGIPGAGMLYAPLSTFNLKDVKSITWMPQTGVAGVNYDQTLPLNVLTGVDRIAFGLYLSPLYLNTSGPEAGTIGTTPTSFPIQPPSTVIPVSFHLFLPAASSAGNGKIPLIIYGHGLGDSQFGAPTFAASTWAQKGFATLAIEITGHGFGPLSTTQITTNNGNIVVPTPGRGIQFSPAAPIGPSDGCILPTAIGTRDCSRQTAVDLFALVAAIKTNQGLGLNLDPSRIYYTGQSFGSFYGTLFEAVEPNVPAGTLNGGGGTQVDVARLSPSARLLGATYLAGFTPSLLNVPPAPSEAYFHDSFNDEYIYRGQAIVDSVPGALAIQSAFEQADWLGMLGDPLSYAGHLKTEPLPGVPAKRILVQFGVGDLEVPNPTESALVRAGRLQPTTWMLRTDLAAAIDPRLLGLTQPGSPLPIYPHRFLSNPTLFDPLSPPLETAIGVAAQKQIADFFASGTINDPNRYFTGSFAGRRLFENPAILPDALNFLQIQP
jgi:Bacterial Ig-like domain